MHKIPFYMTSQGTTILRTVQFHVHANVTDEILIEALLANGTQIDEAYNAGKDTVITYDCGYPIGHSLCVERAAGSPHIYFKVREPRKYQSRMVHGAIPVETSLLTMVLKYNKKNMLLVTAWAGTPAQPELGNIAYFESVTNPSEAIIQSADFWMSHALKEEEPSVEDLVKDVRIIAGKLGLDASTLTASQLDMILASRLGINKEEVREYPLYKDVLISIHVNSQRNQN